MRFDARLRTGAGTWIILILIAILIIIPYAYYEERGFKRNYVKPLMIHDSILRYSIQCFHL